MVKIIAEYETALGEVVKERKVTMGKCKDLMMKINFIEMNSYRARAIPEEQNTLNDVNMDNENQWPSPTPEISIIDSYEQTLIAGETTLQQLESPLSNKALEAKNKTLQLQICIDSLKDYYGNNVFD